MKNKIVVAVSVIGLLTGCSASTMADTTKPPIQEIKVYPDKSVKDNLKEQRNLVRMRQIVGWLKSRVNKTPYVYSGSSTRGWDCSGMVKWAYGQFGIELPHSATAQAHAGQRVSKPKLGDVVVFAYQGRTDFYHSAIYLGNGKIINSNLMYGTTVIQPLKDFAKSQIRFVRMVATPTAVSASLNNG